MRSVLDILIELDSTSSKLEKLGIMSKNVSNTSLYAAFKYALEPSFNYYVTGNTVWDAFDPKTPSGKEHISIAWSYLRNLADRVYTGHAAITHIVELLCRLNADDRIVIIRVLNRDLRCGVNTGASKIWPDMFDREYPVMLCAKDDPKTRAKIKFPAYHQLKSDGMRVGISIVDLNGVYQIEAKSRNGKVVDCINSNIRKEMIALRDKVGFDFVLDGELLCFRDDSFLSRKEGNGIANKAVRGTITPDLRNLFVFQVWDLIDYDIFVIEDKWNVTYKERFAILNKALISPGLGLMLIPNNIVHDWKEADKLTAAYMKQGLEGAVIKNLAGIWENKRSSNCVKVKAKIQSEFLVLEELPGKKGTKYESLVGSLRCRDLSGQITFDTGSGLTDADRQMKGFYKNKIVTVEYNEIITNKKGEKSLFLPIVIEIREDKDQPDDLS